MNKTFSAFVIIAALSGPAFAQPSPYEQEMEMKAGEARRRAEYEAVQAQHRERQRQSDIETEAAIKAHFAKEKAEKEAIAREKAEAQAKADAEYQKYLEAMTGSTRKTVLSALACLAREKREEIVYYIKNDNRYAGEAGVVNLRQRDDWKEQLQHWDTVAKLAKHDGGTASCKSKPVLCLITEDCESPHGWVFSQAWEQYTMQAYQEIPVMGAKFRNR